MRVEESGSSSAPASDPPAVAARRLMRQAITGSLGTLLKLRPGHPYTSLVLTATQPDGSPVLLISRLALHTKNVENDARASLLIDGTAGLGDPLTGGRLTLVGHVQPTDSPAARARFLARHPSARVYADFDDFRMYAFTIDQGHYIGGFGRIVDLLPSELLSDVADAQALIAGEPDIVAHMNGDHRDAVSLYATELAQCAPGDWQMTGIDPEGIDLLHRNNAARVLFANKVQTPAEARTALVGLAKEARARRQGTSSQ